MSKDDRHWKFRNRAGKWFVDGKVFYPDYLSISLDKKAALQIIESLSRQMQDDLGISLTLYGKLSEQSEDE